MTILVPLGAPHFCTDDVVLGGYDIPKGTILFVNLYSVSIDQKYWSEPEKFEPGRFLDGGGKIKPCDAHIPFSEGKPLFVLNV